MPFVSYKRPQAYNLIGDPDQIPIFLIPGILGNRVELHALAHQLAKQSNHQRPIYIYHDERLDDDTTNTYLNIEEQTQTIVQEMEKFRAPGPIPYLVAGYSYGCILASNVGKLLKANDQETHLFLIDGVPLSLSQSYFDSDAATFDLVSIVNYVATMSSLNVITLNDDEIKKLQIRQWDEQIDVLFNTLLAANPDADLESATQATKLISIAKQNIQAIMASKPEAIASNKVDSINALITDATEKKHQANVRAAWSHHSQQSSFINVKALLTTVHTDLLKKPAASDLARLLNEAIKYLVPKKKVLEKQISHLIERAALHEEQQDFTSENSEDTYYDPFESDDENDVDLASTSRMPRTPANSPISGWSSDTDTTSRSSIDSDTDEELKSDNDASPPASPQPISPKRGLLSTLSSMFPPSPPKKDNHRDSKGNSERKSQHIAIHVKA